MTDIVLVHIGRFIRPHGLKGEILIHSFTEDPLAIGDYGPVYALLHETPKCLREKDLPQPFIVTHVRHGPQPTSVVLSIEGFTTRTDVEIFLKKKCLDIFIPRTQLRDHQLEEEEFFHADLIGLKTYNTHDILIGHVVALHNFGAGDILEIQRIPQQDDSHITSDTAKNKRGKSPTFMVPFRRIFVPHIDLARQRLTVDFDDKDEARAQEHEPHL